MSLYGRGPIASGRDSVDYPHPFFDLAGTYMPKSTKELFKIVRYYNMSNPLIASVHHKMSEYPVTPVVWDTEHAGLQTKYKHFFEYNLDIDTHRILVGMDYFTYGNCIVSVIFPFRKFLICPKCKKRHQASSIDYEYREFKFSGTCSSCKTYVTYQAEDVQIRSEKEIRLHIWPILNISIEPGVSPETNTYAYHLPNTIRNKLLLPLEPKNKRHKLMLEATPEQYFEAAKKGQPVILNNSTLYHFKRPAATSTDFVPLSLPVLKDVFYLQILKKSQEMIARENIVPLRTVFPQMSSASADPYVNVNLSNWANLVVEEIKRWRIDRNYTPVFPIPLGSMTLGGDARALMLHQEIRAWSEQIIAGMSVPIEFIFGGMQYSGSNVSLRMLENQFLVYIRQTHRYLRWLVDIISSYMEWEPVECHLAEFKMADDLSKKQLYVSLNQMGKLDDATLLGELDKDIIEVRKKLEADAAYRRQQQVEDAIAAAEAQGAAAIVTAVYQMKAQKAMQADIPGAPGLPGEAPPEGAPEAEESPEDLEAQAQSFAQQVLQYPEARRAPILESIKRANPQLAAKVTAYVQQNKTAEGPAETEQKPPRREQAKAVI